MLLSIRRRPKTLCGSNCRVIATIAISLTTSYLLIIGTVHAKDTELSRTESSAAQVEIRSERLNQAASADSDCMLRLSNTESGKVITTKVIIPSRASSEKYELLGSTDAITPSQSAYLKTFLASLDACRVQQRSKFSSVPGFTSLFRRYELQLDIALARLLKNQTSIGEFNQSKLKFEQDLLAGLEIEDEKLERESKQDSARPKSPVRPSTRPDPATTSDATVRNAPKQEPQASLESQPGGEKLEAMGQPLARQQELPSIKNTGKTGRIWQPKSLEKRIETLNYPQPLAMQVESFSTAQPRKTEYLRVPPGAIGQPSGPTLQAVQTNINGNANPVEIAASKNPVPTPAVIPNLGQGSPRSDNVEPAISEKSKDQGKNKSKNKMKAKEKTHTARRVKKTGPNEGKPKTG